MKKFLFQQVGLLIALIAILIFAMSAPAIFKPTPERPTYAEYLQDSRRYIRENKITKIYLLQINSDRDNGGLSVAYNGCIHYHKKFIGCDKKIAESFYNWMPNINK